MSEAFSFLSPERIVFGTGKLKELGPLLPEVAGHPHRCLVVTGTSTERPRPVLDVLEERGIEALQVHVSGEPTLADARRAVSLGRELEADCVIAVGGGSAIDLAKASAALLPNEGQPIDYLEVIGAGKKLKVAPLPCVALPTTSGTGAEVTKNAVLRSVEHGVKVSLRHDSMIPRLALLDPALTYTVPPDVTAATGLDALTQCIEPWLSRLSNPLTDGIAQEGIVRGAHSLVRAVRDGRDEEARADMALCSLFGGLALANSKLGAVHGIAGVVGGMYPSPHGAVCARLLPHVLRVNLQALREREPDNPVIGRFERLAELLTGRSGAAAEEGIEWVSRLVAELGVPPLSEHGLGEKRVDEVVEKAQKASSIRGNPLELSVQELSTCVRAAL